jgi:hypothetical protein
MPLGTAMSFHLAYLALTFDEANATFKVAPPMLGIF